MRFKEELHVAFLGDLFTGIVCTVELKIIHFEDYIYPTDYGSCLFLFLGYPLLFTRIP